MNLQQLQTDCLACVWLLLLLPLIVYAHFFLHHYRQSKLQALADPKVLSSLLTERHSALFWIKACLYWIAFTCAALALMGPKGNERYAGAQPKMATALQKATARKRADRVIFLLDASASMQLADALGKERIAAAKEIIEGIISRLKGENVALYAFTAATVGIVPLTTDYLFTRMMLQQIQINEGETAGTDIKQALEQMRQLYFSNGPPVVTSLVILSDGGDTSLESLSGEAKIETMDQIIQPIEEASQQHLHVYAVGIGSKEGGVVPDIKYDGKPVHSALEEQLMRKLGTHGRGAYFSINDQSPSSIAQAIAEAIDREQSYADQEVWSLPGPVQHTTVFDYYFWIPLLLAIAALALILGLPDTHKKILAFAIWLIAAEPLWHTPTLFALEKVEAQMQAAANLSAAGDGAGAISKYKDLLDYPLKSWEFDLLKYNIGTVHLRKRQWDAALTWFQQIPTSTAPLLLNANLARNTALSHLGRAADLIKALPSAQGTSPFQQTNSLFLQFQIDFEVARKAECRLSHAIGATTCSLSPELKEMDQQAMRQFAHFLAAIDQFQAAPSKGGQAKNAPDAIKNLLEQIILAQEHAKQLNQMSSLKDNLANSANWGLLASQKEVLNTAIPFLSTVVQRQKELFSAAEGTRCQKSPWDQVIPLFIEGKNSAEKGETLLSQEQFDPAKALQAQQEAVLKWRAALSKLEQAEKEREEAQKQAAAPEKEKLKEEQETNETLRSLQQMEEDDRSHPHTVLQGAGKQEERPW